MLQIALMLALAASASPWSAPVHAPGASLRCPVASSRALDRPIVLPDGKPLRFNAPTRGEVSTRAVACDRDGRHAAAWTEDDDERITRLRIALRGRVRTLARANDTVDDPEISDVALAFAPDGELLVVWAEVWRVRAVTFSRQGRRGEVVTLGHASESTVLGAEFAANGRAVVAWTTQDLGEERNNPHVIRAAFRQPGGLFGPAAVVDPGRVVDPDQYAHDPQSGLRLAVGRDGRALLMWGGLTRRGQLRYRHPVRLASAPPRGGFGAWRTLTPEGFPGDVAVSRDGTPLVVWMAGDQVFASVSPGRSAKVVDRVQPAEGLSATWLQDGHAEVGWLSPGGHHIALRRHP